VSTSDMPSYASSLLAETILSGRDGRERLRAISSRRRPGRTIPIMKTSNSTTTNVQERVHLECSSGEVAMPMEPIGLQCICAHDLRRCDQCGSERIRELGSTDTSSSRLFCDECGHMWVWHAERRLEQVIPSGDASRGTRIAPSLATISPRGVRYSWLRWRTAFKWLHSGSDADNVAH
jgi:hypothetical protein